VVDCGAFGDGDKRILEGTEAGDFAGLVGGVGTGKFAGSDDRGVCLTTLLVSSKFSAFPPLWSLPQPETKIATNNIDIILFIS
jgi:hypothetical protein